MELDLAPTAGQVEDAVASRLRRRRCRIASHDTGADPLLSVDPDPIGGQRRAGEKREPVRRFAGQRDPEPVGRDALSAERAAGGVVGPQATDADRLPPGRARSIRLEELSPTDRPVAAEVDARLREVPGLEGDPSVGRARGRQVRSTSGHHESGEQSEQDTRPRKRVERRSDTASMLDEERPGHDGLRIASRGPARILAGMGSESNPLGCEVPITFRAEISERGVAWLRRGTALRPRGAGAHR